MLTPQIQKKQFLIWSLISTSARPIPRKVADTTGLMNVAQLRQTTIRDSWGLTPMFSRSCDFHLLVLLISFVLFLLAFDFVFLT